MADAALVLHKCARSQRMGVKQNMLRRLCYSLDALKPVNMVAIGGVRYTMVDFILQPLERAGRDVARSLGGAT